MNPFSELRMKSLENHSNGKGKLVISRNAYQQQEGAYIDTIVIHVI